MVIFSFFKMEAVTLHLLLWGSRSKRNKVLETGGFQEIVWVLLISSNVNAHYVLLTYWLGLSRT